jgi:hypothetical protein
MSIERYIEDLLRSNWGGAVTGDNLTTHRMRLGRCRKWGG